MMPVILASASPRRRELLKLLLPEFTACEAETKEVRILGEAPEAEVLRLAEEKARWVAVRCAEPSWIISADTMVELDGRSVGKPADSDEAAEILRALSGRTHKVRTGLCVLRTDTGAMRKEEAVTEVTFDPLTEEEILASVATGEPMGKAGAYGIQSNAAAWVRELRGCYYNVMGMPLNLLKRILREMGGLL